ncbi:MAG TPA: DNA-binding response regulator [Microscillaceae bacterium]|nr:DNA-binding response regulator [Microscillaceae bacterium]
MKIVIIEDEKPAREKLKRFIQRYAPQVSIVAELASISQAVDWFTTQPIPALIFADIELLDGNVFHLFKQIPHVACPVIFTTSYNQFWMEAFQSNGIEYLLKPFSYERFTAAWDKYQILQQNFSPDYHQILQEIQQQLSNVSQNYKQRFTVKTKTGIYFLDIQEVAYLKAEQGVVFAYTQNKKRHLLPTNTLTQMEPLLNPAHFYRVNRSEIVHLLFIDHLEPYSKDSLAIILKYNLGRLISSQSRTPGLKQWLDGL